MSQTVSRQSKLRMQFKIGKRAHSKELLGSVLGELRPEIKKFVTQVVRIEVKKLGAQLPERWLPSLGASGGGVSHAAKEGETFKRDVLAGPDMLTPEEAARQAGMSRQALDERRRKNKALALGHLRRGFRYPKWQFEDKIAAATQEVLATLSHRDAWGQFLFFTEKEPLLGGKTPLEALRAGNLPRVIEVARKLDEDESD